MRGYASANCTLRAARQAKAEGTLNVGAFLKNSDAMLALWDSSYAQRQANRPAIPVPLSKVAVKARPCKKEG